MDGQQQHASMINLQPRSSPPPAAVDRAREHEENEKDILFPPEKAFYLVGFDQRQSREKLYKAIKKYCWVVKFDLPRSQKKGCQNKGYAFVHTCSKDIVDSIRGAAHSAFLLSFEAIS